MASRFKPMKSNRKPRIIMSVRGDEKTGKTHLALTAPGPIAYLNSDIGHEGVVEKFLDAGKRIDSFDFYSEGTTQAEWEEEWNEVISAYTEALDGDYYRSILWDTETDMWLLARLAEFGRTSVKSHHYGPINKAYTGLIHKAYFSDKNLIMLHRNTDEYINDNFTGGRVRSGFKQCAYLSQLVGYCWRYEDGGDFAFTVDSCRQNPDIVGMDFEGDAHPLACTFQDIAAMVLPNVDPEVWR